MLNYRNGRFRSALEHVTITIQNENGQIEVNQIVGQIARRIVNKSELNKNVHRGDYMGLIKLSSRVDVKLPLNTEILVKRGDKVYGNITKLAKWNV